MRTVTSARNPALKEIRKAIVRGSLTEDGYAVTEGFHLLEEALRTGCEVHSIYTTENAAARVHHDLPHVVLAPDLFRTIVATETSQGIIALVRPPRWTLDDVFSREGPVLVVDGVQDPGNAGAMIRAAEAFQTSGVAMLKGSVDPYNSKALRASAGSIFRVPIVSGVSPEAVIDRGRPLFALMPLATLAVHECNLDGRCALVVGNEGHGVSEALRSQAIAIRIPTQGVESLNAAMAASIVLYEASRQRGKREQL
jgi:TrmH family RNA methyltransferase